MAYSVQGLEKSRTLGFRPRNIFGMVLKEFLNLSNGLKIVDLGCGTGFFTRIIAEQVNADVTGIDINENLLDGAVKIADEQNLEIKYETGNITDIKYPDNTFDVVMCDIMLECFKDISVPLKEMKRVCKTGGIVAAIEPFYQGNCEYYPEMDNEMKNLNLRYSRADSNFGVGPMLPNLFNEAGLSDIDLVSWLWGRIGYKTLDYITIDERIKGLEKEFSSIKNNIRDRNQLTAVEKDKIISFYEARLNSFKQNPLKLKHDMSVLGLPVFIVKGTKSDDVS